MQNLKEKSVDREENKMTSARQTLHKREPNRFGSRKRIVDLTGSNLIHRPTAVRCEKGVRCWSLVGIMVPCCGCSTIEKFQQDGESVQGSTIICTIFGYRKGKVNLCIQEDPRGAPFLILELAMPTYLLVREMSSGLLRIALECEKRKEENRPLFAEPVWSMFCNGRKVGFAMKRHCTDSDQTILSLMQLVTMGAGVIPIQEGKKEEEEIMYMRATYERVVGSADSESYHMINPGGSPGQELSIFFIRA